MKKLLSQYSYAIILILLSCSFALILSIQNYSNDQNKYLKITISDGDSLWKISKQYSDQHSLSNEDFVGWVKEHNENIGDQIYPGEEIIIPITKKPVVSATEFASAIDD